MKRLVAAIAVAFAACAGVFAQGSAKSENFDVFCKKISAHENIVGKFEQVKTIAKNGRSLKSSGKFVFCNDGFVWATEKPFKSSMIVTQSALIQVAPNGKKTVTESASNSTFAGIAAKVSALLGGDGKVLADDFEIDFSSVGGKWNAVFLPKSKAVASVMKKITISGAEFENSATFEKIVMTEKNDNTTSYSLFDQKYPKELSADEQAFFTKK